MNLHFPFRYLEPTFFSGLLDDPILLLRVRPLGRSLLIDCGQIHHLAKRVIKSVDALFITHAHMDHFMGIDTFTRNVHVSPKTIEIFGPPGLAEKLEFKLKGYDWNLTEKYWCSYRVQEIFPGHTKTFLLPGPEGFPCRLEREDPRPDPLIYQNAYLTLEADLCDHKIPTLMFKITEKPAFCIDEEKIEAQGLVKGPWLKDLKRHFYSKKPGYPPLRVLKNNGSDIEEHRVQNAEALYRDIRKNAKAASIGYLTDVGFTRKNMEKIFSLMKKVDLLICECTFLLEDVDKARKSYHLCTADLNVLLQELRPPFFLPMHLSKSYIGRSKRLYEQLSPPSGTTILRIPEHVAPRPLLPNEIHFSR